MGPVRDAAALSGGFPTDVRWFLCAGGDVNAANRFGYTPMFCAAEHHHMEVLKWLHGVGESHRVSHCGLCVESHNCFREGSVCRR